MKKFFLLLAAVGMIFTACEAGGIDEENGGNPTEQPGGGDQGEEPIFITDNESDIVVEAKGGTVVVTVSTNLEYSVVIPEEAQSWLSVADTRAIRMEKLTFTIAKNETEMERSAEVKLLNIENNELKSITFIQKEGKDNSLNHIECASNEIMYRTKYGYPITLYSESGFGAKLMSNTYENGVGRLIFDTDITAIGNESFRDCTSIIEVKFPDKATSIGRDAFRGCSSLTTITIPYSVTSIGDSAFYGCSSLTDTYVNITDLAAYAISNNTRRFPGNKHLLVNGTEITELVIPDSVTSIGNGAFDGCTSLTSITIPDSVTSIGNSAFDGCTSLTSITIPDSVTKIGDSAFYNCTSLTNVTIGNGVTEIGYSAFYGCTSLKEVYCKPTTPPTGDSDMFDDNASGRKIYVPRNSVSAYKAKQYWRDYASDIVGYDF